MLICAKLSNIVIVIINSSWYSVYHIFSMKCRSLNKCQVSNKCQVNCRMSKFKINVPGIYLRSGVYLKLNLYVTDSHLKFVIAILKRIVSHYSTSVQFTVLIPTKGSWPNVLYMLVSTCFSHLVLNFIDYRKKNVFYSCFTVVLYFAIILGNLKVFKTKN